MSDIEEIEEKIEKGRKREKVLRQKKAEGKARLEEKQRQFRELEAKVEKAGYSLSDLDEVANAKKSELNGLVAAYHQALDEAEERFQEYEQEE